MKVVLVKLLSYINISLFDACLKRDKLRVKILLIFLCPHDNHSHANKTLVIVRIKIELSFEENKH